jgi:hypothetical protein
LISLPPVSLRTSERVRFMVSSGVNGVKGYLDSGVP